MYIVISSDGLSRVYMRMLGWDRMGCDELDWIWLVVKSRDLR